MSNPLFHENVLFIEDFIDAEELETLLKIIETTPNEDWMIEYTKNLARFCMEKFGRDDVDNLVAEGKFEITQNWADNSVITLSPFANTLKFKLFKSNIFCSFSKFSKFFL